MKEKELEGFISTQILGEFYVTLTRCFGGINAPLGPKEARKEIEEMLSSGIFILLPVTDIILRKAFILSSEKGVKGVNFWDVVVIATVLENEIPILYTENLKDFKKLTDVVAVKGLQEIE